MSPSFTLNHGEQDIRAVVLRHSLHTFSQHCSEREEREMTMLSSALLQLLLSPAAGGPTGLIPRKTTVSGSVGKVLRCCQASLGLSGSCSLMCAGVCTRLVRMVGCQVRVGCQTRVGCQIRVGTLYQLLAGPHVDLRLLEACAVITCYAG